MNSLLKQSFFIFSSSLIFKNSGFNNENSETEATCAYSLSKIIGMNYCNYFRNKAKIFASVGIFNHESEYRKKNFSQKKLITSLVNIYKKKQSYIEVGDFNKK